MKRRYFAKYLATFLIPLLFPLLILGSLSFFTTQHDMKKDINRNSHFLLTQSQNQLELILREIDTLKLALFQNSRVFNELSAILQQPEFSYESSKSYQLAFSFINAMTSSKPYIDSFYFYSDNPYRRFVSSADGISSLDHFRDTSWFINFMNYKGPPAEWTERRKVAAYDLQQTTDVVTIYHVLAEEKIGIFLNIRTAYIERLLRDITNYEGQLFLVLDEGNRVLFANRPQYDIGEAELAAIASREEASFEMELPGGEAGVTKIESGRYGWKYVSVIPHASLYETPSRILNYTVLFACVSFALGLLLTLYLTRRNYRQLLAITSLIRSAENNKSQLQSPKRVKDEYTYIMQNMVQHFIEHRYVQTQLSEKKYKLQFMELLALQSQINPHFLYNTLNSIYWETVGLTGKPNKASTMIEHLSDMLSYSFSNPANEVTWEEEIANTSSYIHIQKQRYKEQFDVEFQYGEDVLPYYTLKLLLQPLVENSLYHGIKEKNGRGLIRIRITRAGEELRLRVVDNGIGIPEERLAYLRQALSDEGEPSRHIGLVNTHRRLRLMYDAGYELRLWSKEGLGTVVSIRLPLRDRPS
ncbi:sensor histidine kinase [Paenibacillus sp. MY03]|uniref:sensor histidine kinase n=1 Tax=Paenibacillus sp. MY03 TaxID=302980 RepID=UPI000B3D2068|nr:sensor histidine kinase [Paenibacillus sp. MY03]OUS74357.1 sensor histidine kinase [Paenibacillus sp. MY03]